MSVCFDLGTRNKLGACPGIVCSGFLRTLAGRIGRILCSNLVVSPAVMTVVHSVYCGCEHTPAPENDVRKHVSVGHVIQSAASDQIKSHTVADSDQIKSHTVAYAPFTYTTYTTYLYNLCIIG